MRIFPGIIPWNLIKLKSGFHRSFSSAEIQHFIELKISGVVITRENSIGDLYAVDK
jgi:hypothetical protein